MRIWQCLSLKFPPADRKRNRLAFAYAALLAFLLIPYALSFPGELTISKRARSLQPGEVVALTVESFKGLRQLQATAFGHSFRGFRDATSGQWMALIGIDLETKPGKYTVKISGSDNDGNPVAADYALEVVAKTFPTRKLTVDEKYVSPPASVMPRIQREAEKVKAIFDAVSDEQYWEGAFIAPVPGAVISAFGKRSVYNGQPRSPHAGTDFQGAEGTPIKAPNAGKVVLAANLYYSGNTVILDHGLGLYSYFGHMSAFAVREGDLVRQGDLVGRVGATGLVTGPHLHWTVRLAGTRVDPISLLIVMGSK
jgi:murein DD-endopeptidase MepM/ murein hydrolase activator NlpD